MILNSGCIHVYKTCVYLDFQEGGGCSPLAPFECVIDLLHLHLFAIFVHTVYTIMFTLHDLVSMARRSWTLSPNIFEGMWNHERIKLA
jgi:hypothetical protein